MQVQSQRTSSEKLSRTPALEDTGHSWKLTCIMLSWQFLCSACDPTHRQVGIFVCSQAALLAGPRSGLCLALLLSVYDTSGLAYSLVLVCEAPLLSAVWRSQKCRHDDMSKILYHCFSYYLHVRKSLSPELRPGQSKHCRCSTRSVFIESGACWSWRHFGSPEPSTPSVCCQNTKWASVNQTKPRQKHLKRWSSVSKWEVTPVSYCFVTNENPLHELSSSLHLKTSILSNRTFCAQWAIAAATHRGRRFRGSRSSSSRRSTSRTSPGTAWSTWTWTPSTGPWCPGSSTSTQMTLTKVTRFLGRLCSSESSRVLSVWIEILRCNVIGEYDPSAQLDFHLKRALVWPQVTAHMVPLISACESSCISSISWRMSIADSCSPFIVVSEHNVRTWVLGCRTSTCSCGLPPPCHRRSFKNYCNLFKKSECITHASLYHQRTEMTNMKKKAPNGSKIRLHKSHAPNATVFLLFCSEQGDRSVRIPVSSQSAHVHRVRLPHGSLSQQTHGSVTSAADSEWRPLPVCPSLRWIWRIKWTNEKRFHEMQFDSDQRLFGPRQTRETTRWTRSGSGSCFWSKKTNSKQPCCQRSQRGRPCSKWKSFLLFSPVGCRTQVACISSKQWTAVTNCGSMPKLCSTRCW